MVLPPDAFEAFLCGSIFDKTEFCLGKRQDMVNVALGMRVGDFQYQFVIGAVIVHLQISTQSLTKPPHSFEVHDQGH